MGDLIERLRALSRHEHDDLSIGDEAADEIERLQSDQRDSDALRERMAAILTDTANALKGEPEPLHVHSWHDLGEVAARVVAERDALRKRIEEAATGVVEEVGDDEAGQPRALIVSTRNELSKGPSLAFKRVALVVLEGGK